MTTKTDTFNTRLLLAILLLLLVATGMWIYTTVNESDARTSEVNSYCVQMYGHDYEQLMACVRRGGR